MNAPAAAALLTHKVANFAQWQKGFDAHESARRSAGLLGHHLNQSVDDPNEVTIYLAAPSQDAIQRFAGSADLPSVMKAAGVVSEPTITSLLPQEDATVKEPLAGAMLTHDVADYATWKKAFDADDARRKAAGIVGYAVNRKADAPNTIVIYLQAKTAGELAAFVGDPKLADVMKGAGVVSKPTVSFVRGLSWASYV